MMQLSFSCASTDPHQYTRAQRRGTGPLSFTGGKFDLWSAGEDFSIYFQGALKKEMSKPESAWAKIMCL